MKMLIAVDFSPVGREAAFNGYRYAQQLGADVTFLHIVPAMATPLEGYNMHFYITPKPAAQKKRSKRRRPKRSIRWPMSSKKNTARYPTGINAASA